MEKAASPDAGSDYVSLTEYDLFGHVSKKWLPAVMSGNQGGYVSPTDLKPSTNAPVQGALVGGRLELQCTNAFTAQMLDKPEILEVVSRKAGAMLGRQTQAVVVDLSAKPKGNPRLEQLMQFGREHADIVKIKE